MNELSPYAPNDPVKMALSELIGENFSRRRTAFIGQCGEDGPKSDLYLITFTGIVLASDPGLVWSGKSCIVYIEEFVDVVIRMRLRQKRLREEYCSELWGQ